MRIMQQNFTAFVRLSKQEIFLDYSKRMLTVWILQKKSHWPTDM